MQTRPATPRSKNTLQAAWYDRGGSAVNLVNPAVEIFRPFLRTGANLHVIYSPQ